jgi:hypothetical protein
MIRRAWAFIAATLMIAIATWLVAWWTVPVVAAIWAGTEREDGWVPAKSAFAGGLAWALLLWAFGGDGSIRRIAEAVGGVMTVGPRPLLALTLVFPSLLAASAAMVVKSVIAPKRVAPELELVPPADETAP